MFNELRSDLVLLYELKQACANCEYELQMLRHRHEALARAGVLGGPTTPASGPAPAPAEPAVSEPGLGSDPQQGRHHRCGGRTPHAQFGKRLD